MEMTRRGFLGSAAGFAAFGGSLSCLGAPCSVYNGVPIGVITYSYRSMPAGVGKTLENVSKYIVYSSESPLGIDRTKVYETTDTSYEYPFDYTSEEDQFMYFRIV